MMPDDWHHRDRKVRLFQNGRSHLGVYLDLFEFFPGEAAGFGNDLFRHGQNANVVQVGGYPQRVHLRCFEPHPPSDAERVDFGPVGTHSV